MPSHTVSAYDKELESLQSIIARMGGLAESQIAAAVDALYKRDQEAAQVVIKTDKQIDELEVNLEEIDSVFETAIAAMDTAT